jgi:hypothetical protein
MVDHLARHADSTARTLAVCAHRSNLAPALAGLIS